MSQVRLSPELRAAVDLIKGAGGTVHFLRPKVEIWGQTFPSLKLVAQDPRCEVGYHTLIKRVSEGVALIDAIKKNPENPVCKSVTCWGENFASIHALALDTRCEVGYNSILNKLVAGMTPEEAVKDSRVRKPITVIEQAIVGA